MKKNIYILFCIVMLSPSLLASPKKLTCQTEFSRESNNAWLKKVPGFIEKFADAQSETLIEQRETLKRALVMCPVATFTDKAEFVFDTEGINNDKKANVELTHSTYCGAKIEIFNAKLESTPSLLYFKWYEPDVLNSPNKQFSVDRKTLAGFSKSWGFSTDFDCELSDIDTSENIL